MRRSSYILLAFSVFLIASCEYLSGPDEINPNKPLPALTIAWTPSKPVVCFGTSLTYGFIWRSAPGPVIGRMAEPRIPPFGTFVPVQALENTYSYPYQLGLTLRLPVINEGLVGARTDQALSVIRDSVLNKNPSLVLLEYPANDLLQSVPASIAAQRLGMVIDSLQNSGAVVVLISFLYPEMIESIPTNHYLYSRRELGYAYLDMMKKVAADHSVQFVEYAMFGIYWDRDLLSDDQLHPNEKGYKMMQQNISAALVNTFNQSGMLR